MLSSCTLRVALDHISQRSKSALNVARLIAGVLFVWCWRLSVALWWRWLGPIRLVTSHHKCEYCEPVPWGVQLDPSSNGWSTRWSDWCPAWNQSHCTYSGAWEKLEKSVQSEETHVSTREHFRLRHSNGSLRPVCSCLRLVGKTRCTTGRRLQGYQWCNARKSL